MKPTSNYDPEVIALKPNMSVLPAPNSSDWETTAIVFKGETVIMAKADGEFNQFVFKRNEDAYTKNKYGRIEIGEMIPAITEAQKLIEKNKEIKQLKCLVEMHVRDNGVLTRVNDFIHYLKGNNHFGQECKGKMCYGKPLTEVKKQIALGFFDLIEINGKKINQSQEWKLQEIEKLLGKQTEHVYVLPHTTSTKKAKTEIEEAWRQYVTTMGYEGLVVYDANGVSKIKPEYEIDAAIVGLNKNDGYRNRQGTSVRLAILKKPNVFVEIGDVASGITMEMRNMLYSAKKEFAMDETDKIAYFEPFMVVKIITQDFFEKDMPTWKLVDGKRISLGLTPSITMRHPRLDEVRKDKEATVQDAGINQLNILKLGNNKNEKK